MQPLKVALLAFIVPTLQWRGKYRWSMFRHFGQCDLIKNAWAVGAWGSLWRQWTQTNDGNQAATRESSLAMPTSLINKSQHKLLLTFFFLEEEGDVKSIELSRRTLCGLRYRHWRPQILHWFCTLSCDRKGKELLIWNIKGWQAFKSVALPR